MGKVSMEPCGCYQRLIMTELREDLGIFRCPLSRWGEGTIIPDWLPMELSVGYRYTARNPVDDTFAYHDHRGMGTT